MVVNPSKSKQSYGRGGSQMQAERLLIAAALGEDANQRFVLLSESCLPLYPAPLVWAQLVWQSLSRIDACVPPDSSDYTEALMLHR